MKFSFNPPTPSEKDQYPVLDTVVTVNSCWHYLSLLEQFVQTTQDIPEVILQQYLVRAEYRYFDWMSKTSTLKNRKEHVPPVDVAFFWQAHMLSPLRFYEDHFRVHRNSVAFDQIKIPLLSIHEARTDDQSAKKKWAKIMGDEPYHLTDDVVRRDFDGCVTITCIICFAYMDILWKDYTKWRLDHTIALQCHRCDGMFTVKHVGKVNFLDDLRDNQGFAGLLIDQSGKLDTKVSDLNLLFPKHKIRSLPFNQGLKPLDDHMKVKQQVKEYGDNENKSAKRTKFLDAIQSTYLCTPYRGSSLDLIQAVARQYKFARKVTTEINWDMPQGIINGIRQYTHFLALIKRNPGLTAVPTIAIDVAWHTHMLHPHHYRNFTMKCLGKFLNHDDTIPETELQYYAENTDHAWKKFESDRRKEEGKLTSKIMSLLKRSSSTATTKKEKNRALTQEEVAFKGYYQIGESPGGNGSAQEKSLFSKSNTSYHDNRDIEELVKLNHSLELLDERFKDVKRSPLGFIGTSNCANTDRLDRWEMPHSITKEEEAFGISEDKYTYKEVLPSTGIKPRIDPDVLMTLPAPTQLRYLPFALEKSKDPRPNTAGKENFDWHQVSRAWEKANKTSGKQKRSSFDVKFPVNDGSACSAACGGTHRVDSGNTRNNNTSSCGSSSSTYVDNSYTYNNTSSCGSGDGCSNGGASPSCDGGGTSSCGGGTSSCGGGSSSCGSS